MSEHKPGLINGNLILKLESTIEQLKQERKVYEKQYHDLIFTNEKLNSELNSLKKVYNDLAESHAKQVIELKQRNASIVIATQDIASLEKCNEELTLLHQVANSSVDILSGEKSALESEVKELKIQASNYAYESDRAKRDRDNAESELLKSKELLELCLDHVYDIESLLKKKP